MTRGSRANLIVLCLALLPWLGAPERPPGLGDVVDVRHWSYDDYTRIVIELDRASNTVGKELDPNPEQGRPARLYFDLPGIWVGRRFVEGIPVGDGLLQRVRIGQNTLRTTRVVVDLARYDRYRLLHLAGPHRVVIDVYGERRGAGDTPERDDLPMELRRIQTVVIDPGHGGKDPGAIGVGGLREKDVTLSLARSLRTALLARGFDVILTRERDETLSLLERTAKAEGVGGDVFISLHANAAPNRKAQGVEIYTLDRDAQRQTRRLAARENGVAMGQVDPLQHLLAQLRLSEVSLRSVQLAEFLHEELRDGWGERWPSVAHAKILHGPFYVLYLSNMPSLLLEAEFLTHRRGAKRLQDPRYLDAMAREIADAMGRFRSEAVVAGRSR